MSQDQPTQEKAFSIQRIYIKDLSFETPHSPAIFKQEWRPEVQLNMASQATHLESNYFEVVLGVTLTIRLGDKTAYLIEVKQAGIFGLSGFTEQELGPMLGAFCPNVLFPYAREVISDLATKGSFPQFVLQPVNFDLLYAQQRNMAETEAAGTAAKH